jgi:hypothetical protein
MRHYHVAVGWVISCLLVSAARGQTLPDPARLIFHEADFCIRVEQPRKLVEAVLGNHLTHQLQAIDAVKELIDSTNGRRFYQLLGYFEKELGADRWELLDRLAGGGIALGGNLGPDFAPRLLVIQAKDEKLLQQFVKLGLDVLEQELARQESKDRPEKKMINGVETIQIGNDFHAAVVGSALVISNRAEPVRQALNLTRTPGKHSLADIAQLGDARRLVGPDPLAWAWLNMETVRKIPQVKDIFAMPRNEPGLTVLFGGWLDVARRSPFLCAGLYAEEHGALLSLRMPAGRDGMPAELATHIPPADVPGSRPLLEPKGVLYSSSYYLDLSRFWNDRSKLFNDKQKKTFEEFDGKTGPFLAGSKMSKLLTQAGVYQRIVVAHHAKQPYKIAPGQYAPAFALVLEMREPETLGKSLETILRGAALLATTQVKLKLVEEKYGGRTIVGYRFPEEDNLKIDANNIRFNFLPCFVTVGKQFVACSDMDLCRELIDLLDKEEQGKTGQGSPASAATRVYASGAVALMEAFRDRLFTQVVLDQALPPDRANEQLQAFIDWVRRVGVVQLESTYGARDFHYDIRLRLAPSEK